MPTLAINIDLPVGTVYDADKITSLVTNYVNRLVVKNNPTEKKSNVEAFRKLRGCLKPYASLEK